jgi:hypothetical protein
MTFVEDVNKANTLLDSLFQTKKEREVIPLLDWNQSIGL